MDNEKANELRRRAKLSAVRKGFTEDSDDLAQEVLLSFLEGRGQHQTVDYAVIDAIRRDRGDSRNGRFKPRKRERRPHCELKEHHSIGESHESRGDFERIIGLLKGGRRAIAVLFFEWELTQKEIGNCFGITESRVSQWILEIESVLRGKLSREALLNKCANLECSKPASPGWKYCSAACAPGSKYSNREVVKPLITNETLIPKKVNDDLVRFVSKQRKPSLADREKTRFDGNSIAVLTHNQVVKPEEYFEIEFIDPIDSHEDVAGFDLEAVEL